MIRKVIVLLLLMCKKDENPQGKVLRVVKAQPVRIARKGSMQKFWEQDIRVEV